MLLEVLVGTVMLAVACVAWLTLAAQTARTLRALHDRESVSFAAARRLERLGIASAAELEGLRGQSRLGPFDLRVAPLTARLFDVVLADTLTGAVVAHTSFYVPHAAP